MKLDDSKLSAVLALPLSTGAHESIEHGLCIMEAVAYVSGSKWTDSPSCASPVIAAFLRNWNRACILDKLRLKAQTGLKI